jgi:hypothetical protein
VLVVTALLLADGAYSVQPPSLVGGEVKVFSTWRQVPTAGFTCDVGGRVLFVHIWEEGIQTR